MWLMVDYQNCKSQNLIILLLYNGQNTMTCINPYFNLDNSNDVLDEKYLTSCFKELFCPSFDVGLVIIRFVTLLL